MVCQVVEYIKLGTGDNVRVKIHEDSHPQREAYLWWPPVSLLLQVTLLRPWLHLGVAVESG